MVYRRDPTTNFFATHLAQLQKCSLATSGKGDAVSFKSDVDASIALCQQAIAGGSLRADMPAVVALMAAIATKYASLSTQTKTAISNQDTKYPLPGGK